MYIELIGSMLTVQDTSDPHQHLTYSGLCLGTNYDDKERVQTWTVINGIKGEMLIIDNQHQSTLEDEYIYHETFVHTLMSGLRSRGRILILGGAEGCMAREVLKWPGVERVVQVDWDESLVNFFRIPAVAERWNQDTYSDSRVEVHCKDALVWLQESEEKFDAIFIDLLDPADVQDICFLKNCIHLCKARLAANGGLAINVGAVVPGSNGPSAAIAEYMTTEFTIPSFHRFAVKIFVPSYLGEWCFLMAVPKTWSDTHCASILPGGLKRFTKDEFRRISQWSIDYLDQLRLFWKHPVSVEDEAKKLTAEDDELKHKAFHHNGC